MDGVGIRRTRVSVRLGIRTCDTLSCISYTTIRFVRLGWRYFEWWKSPYLRQSRNRHRPDTVGVRYFSFRVTLRFARVEGRVPLTVYKMNRERREKDCRKLPKIFPLSQLHSPPPSFSFQEELGSNRKCRSRQRASRRPVNK